MLTHIQPSKKSDEKKGARQDSQSRQITPTFQFVDNRPEKQIQERNQALIRTNPQAQHTAQLQAMADVSERTTQLLAYQEMADNSPQAQEAIQMMAMASPVQRMEMEEEEMLQGKFEPVQRMEEEELLQGKFEPVQRMEEEELLQGKFEPVQRMEEEELLQGKFEPVQRMEEEEMLQGKFASLQSAEPIQRQENNTGLPNNLKSGIENLSGYSMDDVKVHYNSPKPAQLQAHAYAQGTDIHLASGQEKHLAHEAWHVVQQKQGRVKPTMQLKGKVNINDDAGLEREADVMGAKAMRG